MSTNNLTEAIKFDSNKTPYELLPPELLEGTAKVLSYGANKYTRKFDNAWESLLSVQSVKSLSLSIAKDHAALVTRSNSGLPILNLRNDKGNIEGIGSSRTSLELKSWQELGLRMQTVENEMLFQEEIESLVSTDLQKIPITPYVLKGAPYVKLHDFFTLTTIITQGSSEESFVVNATTVLECLEMTFQELKARSLILREQTLAELSGRRNWEKGMSWGRVFGACMRHMWAWWGGQDVDSETGLSHLWHAACCLGFLVAYEQRNIGTDDRNKQ